MGGARRRVGSVSCVSVCILPAVEICMTPLNTRTIASGSSSGRWPWYALEMEVETLRTSLASQTSWRVAPVVMGVSEEVWLVRTDVASEPTDDTRKDTSGVRA